MGGFGELFASTSGVTAPAVFTNPLLAAGLGLALGAGLLLVSRLSAGLVTPDDPALGFTKVAVSMFVRLGVAVAALVAYYVWARSGLVPFGTALVAGFFLMVMVELFLVSRPARR